MTTITLASLTRYKACAAGIKYYTETFAETPTLAVCLRRLIRDNHLDWAEWVLKRYHKSLWAEYVRQTAPLWETIITAIEEEE